MTIRPNPPVGLGRIVGRYGGRQRHTTLFVNVVCELECAAVFLTPMGDPPRGQPHVSAGAHAKSVQRMRGHASAAMTLDVYLGLFEDDLDAVADRLDEAAAKAVVPPACPDGTMTPMIRSKPGP